MEGIAIGETSYQDQQAKNTYQGPTREGHRPIIAPPVSKNWTFSGKRVHLPYSFLCQKLKNESRRLSKNIRSTTRILARRKSKWLFLPKKLRNFLSICKKTVKTSTAAVVYWAWSANAAAS